MKVVDKRQKDKSQNGCFKKTTYVSYQAVRMFVFQKIWRALFPWNTRFEIRPFALLTIICPNSLLLKTWGFTISAVFSEISKE